MDRIIDELYLSAVDDDAAERLMRPLRDFLGGGTCCLWTFEASTGQPQGKLISDQPVEAVRDYMAHYHTIDPWRAPVLGLPGRAVTGAELVNDDVLARSAYYNDFSRKYGMFHLLGAVAPVGAGHLLMAVTTHRAQNREPFEQAQLDRLNSLLPHLQRSMQIRAMLDRSKAGLAEPALEALLDAMNAPALICDGASRVLAANTLAEGAPAKRTLRMSGPPGAVTLQLVESAPSEKFALLVAKAARGEAGGTIPAGANFVTAAPLPSSYARFGVRPGLVLVTAQVLDEAAIAARSATAFGLTRAEAAIAAKLAAGLSPERIAVERGVSLGTVRTLLRRALVKTGADNLRQMALNLVRLAAG